ncbi:hypothetical protein [Microcoleus sp. Pol17_C1]|uniref:hypothetical protein n=1 Tax=unclassified Microcoleus TaxID=2642155 RepID=UPI002FD12670
MNFFTAISSFSGLGYGCDRSECALSSTYCISPSSVQGIIMKFVRSPQVHNRFGTIDTKPLAYPRI